MQPAFLRLNGRRLLGVHVLPSAAVRGAVLFLPSFAEEMNRCRNHVAAAARVLAAQGHHCLLLDPFGTGESDGLLEDSRWQDWRADAVAAVRWLHAQTGQPVALWGVRTGALLAAETATELADAPESPVTRLLFWQPVTDGQLFLKQFLRLRLASQMVHDGDRETTDSLLAQLAEGQTLEVAGYPLTGHMASALAASRLNAKATWSRLPLDWLELVARAGQPLPAASRALVDDLAAEGAPVRTHVLACPPIWQTHERESAPQLPELMAKLWETSP